MKKILVTGATGFIGSYVVQQLLKSNVQVFATSASLDKAARFDWFPEVVYIPFDFASYDDSVNYYQFFNSPDALIHLAWQGLPNYTAPFHLKVNLPAHSALMKNLAVNGLEDVTVTGTCFEYGMKEGCLPESMPAEPANAYAQAKDRLRKHLEQLQQKHPFYLKWVRLFYMYGKGQSPGSLLSQLDKALAENKTVFNMSGGEQLRDYLPVEDVAAGIVKIALQHEVTSIINCCSGKPISVKQLVETYLQARKKSIALNLGYYPYTDYEPMAFWGDNSKLKTIP